MANRAVPLLFMSNLHDKLLEQVKRIEKNGNGESAEVIGQTSAELVPSVGGKDAIDANLEPLYVPQFVITLQEAEQRIQLLQEFVRRYMVPGQDFGLIPGCQKPSLFKSGAEKLCDIYGFGKHIEITNRLEDWDKGIFAYEAKATIVSKRTGHVEAQGVGTANSLEKKYAKQDGFSIQNTIIKMAKKRALIDSVLSATRSSGIFSQDLEDLKTEGQNHPIHVSTQVKASNDKATEEQLQQIYRLAQKLKLTPQQAKQIMKLHYKKDDSRKLTKGQAGDLIRRLTEQKMRKAEI